jgi:hypothetical protein
MQGAERTVGVKVHAVIGQEEIVIKPLGEFIGNARALAAPQSGVMGRLYLYSISHLWHIQVACRILEGHKHKPRHSLTHHGLLGKTDTMLY